MCVRCWQTLPKIWSHTSQHHIYFLLSHSLKHRTIYNEINIVQGYLFSPPLYFFPSLCLAQFLLFSCIFPFFFAFLYHDINISVTLNAKSHFYVLHVCQDPYCYSETVHRLPVDDQRVHRDLQSSQSLATRRPFSAEESIK